MRKLLESKFVLPGALTFALICRLTVAFIASGDQMSFTDPDSKDYIELADNLAAGNGYAKNGEPEVFRAPGYPFVLSFFRRVFKNDLIPMILLQAFLSVGTIYLLWRLALIVSDGDAATANLAVLFQAATLTSIVFSNKILSETIFTFCFTATILLVEILLNKAATNATARRTIHQRWLIAAAAGLFAAASLMLRAIVIPVVPLFAVYILVGILTGAGKRRGLDRAQTDADASKNAKATSRVIGRASLAKAATLAITFLTPVFLAYGAWSYRNWKAANFAGFSSVGQINIYRYYACLLLAKNNNRSFAEQQSICTIELKAQGPQWKQARYAVRKGVPIIAREPVRYLLLHLKTDASSLLPDVGDLYRLLGFKIGGSGTLAIIRSKGILAGVKHYFDGKWGLFLAAVPLMLPLFAKFVAALAGAVVAVNSKKRFTLFFFIALTVYMLAVPGAVSHPRFRVPVEPLLSLLAAFGCVGTLLKRTPGSRNSIQPKELG